MIVLVWRRLRHSLVQRCGRLVRQCSHATLSARQHVHRSASACLERPCWRRVESRPPSTSTEGQRDSATSESKSPSVLFTPNKPEAQPTAAWRKGHVLYTTDCCYCPCGKGEHLCRLEPQPPPRRSRRHFGTPFWPAYNGHLMSASPAHREAVV